MGFKVGDKVKCVKSDSEFLTLGKIYIIKKIKTLDFGKKSSLPIIYINNDGNFLYGYHPNRFELVEEPEDNEEFERDFENKIYNYKKFLSEIANVMPNYQSAENEYPHQIQKQPEETDGASTMDQSQKTQMFDDIQEYLKQIIQQKMQKTDPNEIQEISDNFMNIGKNLEIKKIVDGCKNARNCADEIYNKYYKNVQVNHTAKDNVNDMPNRIMERKKYTFEEGDEVEITSRLCNDGKRCIPGALLKSCGAIIKKGTKGIIKKIHDDIGYVEIGYLTTIKVKLKHLKPLNIEEDDEEFERDFESFKLLDESVQSEKLNGKYGFYMFMEIMDKLHRRFVASKDYLQIGNYLYFYTSDTIKNKYELLDMVEYKKSLDVLFVTLKNIIDKKLCFYFGIKNNILEYGLYDEFASASYKVGQFEISNSYVRNLDNYKCLALIKKKLNSTNIKNVDFLHKIRKDFKQFLPEYPADIDITSEWIMKKEISKDNLQQFMTEERQLFKEFNKWAAGYIWSKKVDCYIDPEEGNNVTFYIKIKDNKFDDKI